jgi:UDP-glucose 4-epimerase
MDKKVLVTGCNGYIAPFIIEKLVKKYNVTGIDLHPESKFPDHYSFNYVKLDIRSNDDVVEFFKSRSFDYIVHLAALISVPESFEKEKEYIDTNVWGTINLLLSTSIGIHPKFLFSSTCAVFDDSDTPINEENEFNPRSPYAQQKKKCEELISEKGLEGVKSIVFRFFNVAGAKEDSSHGPSKTSQALIPSTIKRVLSSESPIIFGSNHPTRDGTTIRDYIHPEDLAQAFLLVIESEDKDIWDQSYNLGTGTGYTTKEVVESVMKSIGKELPIEYHSPRTETVSATSDSTKAREMLGWSTSHTLDDIVTSTLKYMKYT